MGNSMLIRLFIILGLCFSTFSLFSKEIKFIWNVYCPYTCDKEQVGKVGYAMELVERVFNHSPYQVSYLRVASWNRAIDLVKSGSFDAIVFSFYTDDAQRDFILPAEPLAMQRGTSFIVLDNSEFRLTDVDSLNQLKRIGVYKNTIWSDREMIQWKRKHSDRFTYLHGDNVFERAMEMLRMQRIDAWEDALGLLSYRIYQYKITDMRIEQVINNSLANGGVMFSRKSSFAAEYAKYFSQGIIKLRELGVFNQVLAKYGQLDFYQPEPFLNPSN